jgi:RecG-like helicase
LTLAPEDPVTRLNGVGPALAARLERLGVRTVEDLAFLLPLRYEDRTRVVPIGALRPGQRAVIEGEILLAEVVRRRRPMLVVAFGDSTGMLTLRFFHFTARQQQALGRGVRLRCFGEVRAGQRGLEMAHPEFQRVDGEGDAEEAALTPIYPGTEGLAQGRIRQLVRLALGALGDGPPDLLPPGALAGHGLPTLGDALRILHRPPPDADIAALPLVAVGTHALFQEGVHFGALGLVIVDEQHRFGVHQRLALREKGATPGGIAPHQLIMTATPIPRTLAMTAYADLDSSVIDELPPGRTPVTTVVLPETRREEVVRRVREACAAGRQAYWVCPLIEESDALEATRPLRTCMPGCPRRSASSASAWCTAGSRPPRRMP